MNKKEKYWPILVKTVIKGLESRNMEGYYCKTGEEAVKMALGMVAPGETVAWGGSVTLQQTGMLTALRDSSAVTVIDRDTASSPEEKRRLQIKSFDADTYFMSTNAITRNGVLINIDGIGNRVGCLIYGPRSIIILAGMNKVADDVDMAIRRARNVAAPANNLRLAIDNPCTKTGHCLNCKSERCICSDIVITRRSYTPGRVKVILIGESFGY